METAQRAVEKVRERFADQILSVEQSAKQTFLHVKRDRIADILRLLRDDPDLAFDCLQDVCGLDYLNMGMPERFCVAYNLYSFKNGAHFRVKAFVPEDDPQIDTASALWRAANWAEREAFDMYGIRFRNHPDLKRILLPHEYVGYPLRKDYPVRGMGERDAFARYVE